MKKFLSALASLSLLPSAAFAWGHCAFGGPAACGPMMPPTCGASQIAPLLIAMAAGFGVVALAIRQTRKLSIVGLILGWFILAVSAAGIGCIAGRALCWRFHRAETCSAAAACPFISGRAPCVAPAEDQPTPDQKKPETKPAPTKAEKKK